MRPIKVWYRTRNKTGLGIMVMDWNTAFKQSLQNRNRSVINLVKEIQQNCLVSKTLQPLSLFFNAVIRQKSLSITTFDNSKTGGNACLRDRYQNKRRWTKNFHDKRALLSLLTSTLLCENNKQEVSSRGFLNVFVYMENSKARPRKFSPTSKSSQIHMKTPKAYDICH